MQLLVSSAGQVRGLYDEALDLAGLGPLRITRASWVEPDPAGAWWVDLRPSDGPVLGPFPCRSQALGAEVQWLVRHRL